MDRDLRPPLYAVVFFWIAAAIFWLPVLVPVGLITLAYLIRDEYRKRPAVRARLARLRAQEMHRAAIALLARKSFPSADEFVASVREGLYAKSDGSFFCLDVFVKALAAVRALYEWEGFTAVPAPPPDATELDYARYQDTISALTAKLSHPEALAVFRETVDGVIEQFRKSLPTSALRPFDEFLVSVMRENVESKFSIDLLSSFEDVPEAVEQVILPFHAERAIAIGLFATLREQFDRNLHEMSGVHYRPSRMDHPKLILPRAAKGSSEEIVHGYLHSTPLERLFAAQIPLDIPEATRFEHHWIVAGSGHGKSQTLQYLIASDLERVAQGGASVVVIDSQGDLIKNIAGLKVFAEGESLHGKLCLIDPTDIEYPVALNLFDVGMERINQYSPLDRERLMNGVLELYDFVLGSLLSAELTSKQSVIFRYITRLMLHIPGATIHTFRELMEPKGYDKYLPYIAKLQGTARAFFETEFNSKQFEETKRQVVRRLWGILENQTFERMFSHPKNKLDLFSEMNAGKVILINTAKELLKQNGTEIFGRFFIALIAQVAQERATLAKEARTPTFVYIDECADYLDQNVSLILEQARKFNVGMILAHQYVGQLSPKLQESFAANTSIKFAGGVSDKDARALSHMLRCEPEFIDRQPKGHFAVSIRNLTSGAVSLRIPFGHLEAMPRMTDEECNLVRADMRERYAVPWTEVGQRGEPNLPSEEANAAQIGQIIEPMPAPNSADVARVDTAPAAEW